MRTWLLTAAVLIGTGTPAAVRAAPPPPDPEAAVPYAWRVVVRFDSHPLLPAGYRVQLLDNIRAALQPPGGDLWRVDVTDLSGVPDDKRDPLWKAFAAKGWQALESAEFRVLTGVKTHFLRVSVKGTTYRLEARQHDGSTGLASPVVRSAETRDAQTVGRLAGMMLARDFGPVGVIEKVPDVSDAVTVRFRGGALPGLERVVKPGDVFAVAAVVEQPRPRKTEPAKGPGGFRRPTAADDGPPIRVGQPRGFVLLRADTPPSDGACRCQVLAGSTAQPLVLGRGVVGFKCLKLGTVEAPVEVRVLDANGGLPAAAGVLQVRAADINFPNRPDPRDTLELRSGVFRSQRPLRDVACVIVGVGTTREARFPVPVFGTDPQTLRLALTDADAARASLELDCENFFERVGAVRREQAVLLDALGKLIQAGKHREALLRVTAGLQTLTAADQELTAELEQLKKRPGATDPLPATYLTNAAEQLASVRAGRPQVDQAAADLKGAVGKMDDPVRFEREFRAKELNARIKTLIEAGEVPDALAAFDDLYLLVKQDDVKERKAKLAAEWEPRGDDHRKARDYVMNPWRSVTTLAEFKAAREPLQDAAAVMTRADDRLGLRNLLSSFETAYARLKTLADTLDGTSEVDRPALKDIQEVAKALNKIETEARAAVRKLEAAAAPPAEPGPKN